MGRVVAIGECLVELAQREPRETVLGYGGDGLATAVYLSRAGQSVSLATALGRGDPFSAGILKTMADEGVDASLAVQAEGRLPGLYAVARGDAGRGCAYAWRGEAPMRDFFSLADEAAMTPALLRALRQAALVWVSGATLGAVGEAGRAKLLVLLAAANHAGAEVAFDVAYRPELWPSPEIARAAVSRVVPLTRYLTMGPRDRALLGGWRPGGEVEVVELLEDATVRVRSPDGVLDIRAAQDAAPRAEAYGAREAFGAAYLASRMAGENPTRAVAAGRGLADAVAAHARAIAPRPQAQRAAS